MIAYVVFYSYIVLLCVHAALYGVMNHNNNNDNNFNI